MYNNLKLFLFLEISCPYILPVISVYAPNLNDLRHSKFNVANPQLFYWYPNQYYSACSLYMLLFLAVGIRA